MDIQEKIQKIQKFFNKLNFEEERHKYFIGKKPIKYSVSGLIKKFEIEEDWKSIAENKDNELRVPLGTHTTMWKLKAEQACALGTRVHYFGELFAFHRNLKPIDGYEEAVVKFWNDLPHFIIPVIMELKMYHKKYMFAGTGDILLYNKNTGKFVICDYKTNQDLQKNSKDKRLKEPFTDILDNALGHYKLQLSFYQILLEQIPGIEVERRRVIHLKSDGNYDMYDTPDLTEKLKIELEKGIC